MSEVVVADYGIGNLLSVERALVAVGAKVVRTRDGDAIRKADRLIVPGVGAFGDCISTLTEFGLVEPIVEAARSGKSVLGICVGMQLLLDASEEFGQHRGLGIIPGRVQRIATRLDAATRIKVPHIGWSGLEVPAGRNHGWEQTILEPIEPGEATYFVHSYNCVPDLESNRLADVSYHGIRIAAAIRHENVTGTQFHPEKSGPVGLRILRKFVGRP